ncbi:hypothetical protein SAY87_016349 [Trapa incisa]|uniref:Calcium uniporter protein n=1 Tax=Trapa incisa TaxID=236973 RepID=A0AAN7QYY1_9MYRT|nr:hypothetical protein SAY87_016349 [Trapa incisa]
MMTLKKTLAQRLFGVSGISRRVVTGGCRGGSHARSGASWSRRSIENDPGQNAPFHRFLHRIPWLMPELRPIPPGDGLMERLVDRHLPTGRVNMDGMIPSPPPDGARGDESPMLTAQDARKLSRAAQMEAATARLREVREICIPYPEFVRVCGEGCPDPGQGAEIAKLIDESGYVVVFGDIVLLQPDMVVEAMVGLMPVADDRRRKELEELERRKTAIDRQAEAQVRREL